MKTEKVDVLVIGAGPAGAVAAAIVHKAGYSVKVVEKLQFPRFVIGESLLPRCMEALEAADLLEAVKAKGFQQKFGAKFVKGDKVCDFQFSEQYTKGWNWTWQVPRADFDKALADSLEERGIPLSYQTTVTAIKFNGTDSVTSVEYGDGSAGEIEAKFIIDGSGYGRVIPRLFNLDRPSEQPPRKTLFAHTVDVKRYMDGEPNRITAVCHKPATWVWIIPFSNGITSLGFVGSAEFFEEFKGTPEEQYRALIASEPYFAERFKDVDLVFEPRTIEAWSTTTDKFYGEGYVLTGNVTEFLDPIFSSGVTLAVSSSQKAGELVVRKLKGENIDWETEYMEPVMQGVNTFRSYVTAWYDGTLDKIFFSDNPQQEIKNKICSVLAGYVWDTSNEYVANHDTALKRLARLIELEKMIN